MGRKLNNSAKKNYKIISLLMSVVDPNGYHQQTFGGHGTNTLGGDRVGGIRSRGTNLSNLIGLAYIII